ncbi:response regulator transcription factor [Sphingobium sp.]|uniref:response regulator transcription factor n=1 Tax=Sphingobium sp. TaxID=1912891 RepID=UPI002C95CCF3|nr:response regulator transcription factor [Sphingobium sp.]HUD93445.1 response regulator transcription factor [Sphingobium sp.]
MRPHSVFLVDDHPVVLRGLAVLINLDPDFTVVGSTSDPKSAFAMIDRLKPDIAVLDINMPDVSGLALLRRMRSADLPARVIFLTAIISDAQLSDALANGIWGLLLKESAPDTLIDCLRRVAAGHPWLPDELAARASPGWNDGMKPGLDTLTPRELEIAGHACRGLSNRLIARELGASEGTVKIHLHNIFQKLKIRNRTALAAIYYKGPAIPEQPQLRRT